MNTMILAANTAAYWTKMFETVVIIGGICVALPIVIVWFVVNARTQKMNRKMDILMKAVESGQQVDPALLVTAEVGGGKYQMKKNRKMDILMKAVENGQQVDPALLVTAEVGGGMYQLKKNILNRLTWGSIMSLLCIMSFLIPVFLNRSDLSVEFKFTMYVIGGVSCAVGIGLLISYFVGKKMLAKEIEAEEAEMTQKK